MDPQIGAPLPYLLSVAGVPGHHGPNGGPCVLGGAALSKAGDQIHYKCRLAGETVSHFVGTASELAGESLRDI